MHLTGELIGLVATGPKSKGQKTIELPVGTTLGDWYAHEQKPEDDDLLSLELEYDEVDRVTLSWNNRTDHQIAFDWKLTVVADR